jgi:hypothetical protein
MGEIAWVFLFDSHLSFQLKIVCLCSKITDYSPILNNGINKVGYPRLDRQILNNQTKWKKIKPMKFVTYTILKSSHQYRYR